MSTPKPSLHLTTEPEMVTWPETHYVFIEKAGPFQDNAPQAWEELHRLIPAICEHNKVTAYTSLYNLGPMVYRAGVCLGAEPNSQKNVT